MASTVPSKSNNNPLHIFDLPYLKWKKNHHSNNHQRRRSTNLSFDSSSPSRHDSPQRQSQSQSPMRESLATARHSPMRDSVVAVHRSPSRESVASAHRSSMREVSSMRDPVPSRQSLIRDSMPPRPSPMSYEYVPESDKDSSVIEYRRHSRNSAPKTSKKSDKKQHKVLEIDAAGNKEGRSKILLKIPRKNKAKEIHEGQKGDESQEVTADEEAAEESAPKTWNLRPRKPIQKLLNLNGGPFRATGSVTQECKSQLLPHMNVNKQEIIESNAVPKKEKRHRFAIALSREEIDEDIYAMTRSKAARRPKKRVKVVQKQLDTLFPGLWLASITFDSYKVCENLPKG
ncbi:unnamed protein product [Withania somnifera]